MDLEYLRFLIKYCHLEDRSDQEGLHSNWHSSIKIYIFFLAMSVKKKGEEESKKIRFWRSLSGI